MPQLCTLPVREAVVVWLVVAHHHRRFAFSSEYQILVLQSPTRAHDYRGQAAIHEGFREEHRPKRNGRCSKHLRCALYCARRPQRYSSSPPGREELVGNCLARTGCTVHQHHTVLYQCPASLAPLKYVGQVMHECWNPSKPSVGTRDVRHELRLGEADVTPLFALQVRARSLLLRRRGSCACNVLGWS